MSVRRATVLTPASLPNWTMVSASWRERLMSVRNAPEPYFTSNTREDVPSAIFLLMMLAAMRGILSTVPVMSRRAYSLPSAGASSFPAAQTTPPTVWRLWKISSLVRLAFQPGMDSSLSKVPPVCPSPRPDSCGTAAPKETTRGMRGRVILSPTPPVECLSVVGLPSLVKFMRSPEAMMALVRFAISVEFMPLR